MENILVPKVVNRHVPKAIYSMGLDSVPVSSIKLEVSYTMKNVNPVYDLESAIESSLENLTKMGILKESINASDKACYATVPGSPTVTWYIMFDDRSDNPNFF